MLIKTQIETKLDAEIQAALDKLKSMERESDAYGKLVEHISRLHKLKIEEVEQSTKLQKLETENRFGFSKQISPDTVLVVAANIFGILWLARYERENVIRSRSALGFVMKPRS